MTKFRVFWGILVVFLVFSTEINATKPVVEDKGWPQNYRMEYPKQEKWAHFPITRHRIFHELGLSEEQLEEIHSLRHKHREELRILRKEQKESIINVLSPDQKSTLDKRLEEIKDLEVIVILTNQNVVIFGVVVHGKGTEIAQHQALMLSFPLGVR